MLPDPLPVLVGVYLLTLLDVPEKNDNGRHNRDDRPQPLVVPLHVVKEQANTLTCTWPVVVAVEEFLGQFVEQLDFAGLTIIISTALIVNAWVVLE